MLTCCLFQNIGQWTVESYFHRGGGGGGTPIFSYKRRLGSFFFFLVGGGGGGGGTPIFSYKRRLGSFWGVQNFEFQYFLGVLEKIIYFLGYEDFVDIFFLGGGGG